MNFINSQDAVVFRYNSDPACIESVTDVQLSNLSIEQRTDPIEQIARGSEGWGFSKRYTTLFDNDSSPMNVASISDPAIKPINNLAPVPELPMR